MPTTRILFLAANPISTTRLALDEECAAIDRELRMTRHRDDFEFRTKWAVTVDEMMRHLMEWPPTVIHFSGHGTGSAPPALSSEAHRYAQVPGPQGASGGIYLQNDQGGPQLVTDRALQMMLASAASSARVVVLNACYSEPQVTALCGVIDCVIGMTGAIRDDAARSFAVGFYRGLGNRRSVGNAFDQAVATLAAKGLPDEHRPRCRTREGIDAHQLLLDTPSDVRPDEPLHSSTSGPASTAKVDVGILTIRDDEFRAVLAAFPRKAGTGVHSGASRHYILRRAEIATGERYTIAIVRQVEQGTGEAQHAAHDLIDDLAPRLVLVVGIAGGLPSDELTLGDVVLGTRIHDYTVEAVKAGLAATYAATGGPIDKAIAGAVATLAGREDELGDWTSGLPSQPAVTWLEDGQVYGPLEWQRDLRAKLEHHHGEGSTRRAPTYVSGPIASSDRLVKDPTVLFPWITTARNLLAVEMESGGVYRAARERCPMLPIRGISDIVGLRRADAWTKFACASAAAFARAFLRTRPVAVGASLGAADP